MILGQGTDPRTWRFHEITAKNTGPASGTLTIYPEDGPITLFQNIGPGATFHWTNTTPVSPSTLVARGTTIYTLWHSNSYGNLELTLQTEELTGVNLPIMTFEQSQQVWERSTAFQESFNRALDTMRELLRREQQIQTARNALENAGPPDLRGVCPRLDQCHDPDCHLAHPIQNVLADPPRDNDGEIIAIERLKPAWRKKPAENARLNAFLTTQEKQDEET